MSKRKDDANPAWTKEMVRRARPAREVFTALDLPKPKTRGKQKSPTKVQTTIRLDVDVIKHFRAQGRGWQTRLNATLRDVVARKKKRA